MCLMLEFLSMVPGDSPSLGFPKSRPEIRVQGQGVYWEVLVTPGEKGDVIWGRSSSGHRVLVTPGIRVGAWGIVPPGRLRATQVLESRHPRNREPGYFYTNFCKSLNESCSWGLSRAWPSQPTVLAGKVVLRGGRMPSVAVDSCPTLKDPGLQGTLTTPATDLNV